MIRKIIDINYCDYLKLELALADFVVKRKNIQATLSAAIGGERQDHISKRKIEISNFYFGYIERRSIAKSSSEALTESICFTAIRRKCGNECRFKPRCVPTRWLRKRCCRVFISPITTLYVNISYLSTGLL